LRYGDGWIPHSRRPQYEDVTDFLPHFRQMAAEAGRDPAEVPITVWGIGEDIDRLHRYRDQGVARVVVSLPSEPAAKILPALDRWAELIRKIRR
jgi:alkanesulfonate monooxygenase SsuD/methylene tetrahydromethanopterin reductase-like flavin-dependent oxidoreductase (luciferase family)